MRLVADLSSRGLLAQVSVQDLDERLSKIAAQRPIAAYAGFDPTADSLHVGHFMGILGLIYAQRNGIRPIAAWPNKVRSLMICRPSSPPYCCRATKK